MDSSFFQEIRFLVSDLFLRKNNRQTITGIVINNPELGLPRMWIRRLKAAIYNANKVKKSGSNLPIEKKERLPEWLLGLKA